MPVAPALASTLALILFILTSVVAAVGVIVPVVPGVLLAAVGAVLAALIVGFERFGTDGLIYVGVLAVASQLVDVAGTWLGSKHYGAGKAGLWGGIIGSFVGVFVIPPFGFLIGALAGATVAELLVGRRVDEAFRSGVGAFVGTLGGTVAKLVIVVVMGIVVVPRLFGA